MPIFYLDYVNGLDATTNTPLGWWSVAFNNGTGNAPSADDVVTGATSGHHGHLTVVGAITGTWAGNNAAGIMYFYGCDDLIHTGEQIDWHDGHAHTTGAAVYCAWKTLTLGATAARIVPGDTIRIAKSPVPVSIGNAAWTDRSKTVTLATAGKTLPICMCEADWTADHATNSAKIGTDWKEGTYAVMITADAGPSATERQAWVATGALNLSSYQYVSFWIKNEVAILANQWEINLYPTNDATGAPDHTIAIPAIPSTAKWVPLTIYVAASMTNGINSISVDCGSSYPTASKYIYLDNIIATKTGDINLQSLISKNSSAQGGTEPWLGIQSINGTTVLIDCGTNTKANVGQGYYGSTDGSAATYIRETIKTPLPATIVSAVQSLMDSGTAAGGNISYQGGFDSATNEQNGETFFDGLNGWGYGIYSLSQSYNTIKYLNAIRYSTGFHFQACSFFTVTLVTNANNNDGYGLQLYSGYLNTITAIQAYNNGTGLYLNGGNYCRVVSSKTQGNMYVGTSWWTSFDCYIVSAVSNYNAQQGVEFAGGTIRTTIGSLDCNYNGSYGIRFNSSYNTVIQSYNSANNVNGSVGLISTGWDYIRKSTMADNVVTSNPVSCYNQRLFSEQEDGTVGNNWIYIDGGLINSQGVTRAGASGLEWKIDIASSVRVVVYPLVFSIARIAVVANKLVTVTAYLTKGHATNVEGAIRCRVGQIAWSDGTADIQSTAMSGDTNAQQKTITFTPTESGVVEIEAIAWYVSANGTLLVDTIGILQAA
jgi:hypothetical protein